MEFDILHMCSKRQVKQEINWGIPYLSYSISTADLTDVGNPLHMQEIGLSEVGGKLTEQDEVEMII